MLLVDDDERELPELHALLEQRVRADDDGGAAVGDGRERRGSSARRLRADQRGDLDAERLEPAVEAREMLLGEQLRRRHHGRLAARRRGDERGHRSHHRLAGADVALQQPVHRCAPTQVGDDLVERGSLRARQRKRQRGAKRIEPRGRRRQRPRALRAVARGGAPQAQALRNELLEREPARARMPSRQEQLRGRVARRRMQIAQRVRQWRPRRAGQRLRGEGRREVVIERLALECRERARDDAAHRLLVQALGRRIDGRQAIVRLRLVGTHRVVLGMNHLEALGTASHLAVAAHALATRERLLDRFVEVEEPQRDCARAIGEPAEQRAPAAEGNLAELDDALDERFLADGEAADRPHRRAVFVTLREQAQQVAERTARRAWRGARQPWGPHPSDSRPAGRTAISLAQRFRPPTGRECRRPRRRRRAATAATPMAARAGYGSLQYSAMISLTIGKWARSVK